jgi:flagellar hook-length control protein FliK
MSAATVVVSSAEGAGDMPSSVPVGGGDSSTEGAPPFSEVLSRSSSDQPDASDASNASPPALPSPDSGEAGGQTGTVPTALPVSSKSGAGAADPSREPVQGRATPSKPGVAPFPRPSGSPPPSRTDVGDRTPPPVSAPTQAAGAATDAAGSPSVAASSTEAPSTPPASELPTALTAVTASTPSEGSPVAGAPAAVGGLSTPAFVTTWATNRPHSLDAGTADEDVRAAQVPAGASEVGHTGARGSADPEVAPGSVVLRAGLFHSEASPSTPTASASAFNASAVDAGSTGSSRSTAVSAQEGSAVAAFPDVEAGIASSGLDIGDLAASISRPLAAGGGDYSVQVSLHPPELGQVRALLSLQGDVLHVTLTPEHASGFDALSDALPTLHDQLAGGGVEVHVSLGQPGDQSGGDGGATTQAGSVARTPSDDMRQSTSLSAVPTTSADPGRIHLIL